MIRARLLALVLVSTLAGCDVAVGVYFATRNKDSKKSSLSSSPDTSFSIWVADLTAVVDTVERQAIADAGGNPGGNWTPLGSATETTEFTMPVGTFNAVLIQATDAQIYHIDAIEVLDATGTTTATATAGTLFSDQVNQQNRIAGPPDAVVADTTASATNKAFVFFHHTASFTQFRVSLWKPTERAEGDVEWVATYNLPANQTAGGAAVNSAGMTYLTLREGSSLFLLRYNSAGSVVQDTDLPPSDVSTLATLVTTTSGHSSVAIDPGNDDVFIASSVGAGDIRIQKWVGNSDSPAWSTTALMTSGVDRVERNGLALTSTGDLVIAGAGDFGGLNGIGHYLRRHSKANGSDMWSVSPPPNPQLDANSTPTYWHAVATFGTNDIFPTGDLSSTLGVGPVDVYTARFLDNSQTGTPAVTETWNERVPNGGSNQGVGHSIGLDAAGNAYVGGFYTHTDIDSVILRYGSGAPPASVHLNSSRTGNDEFLDIVVEIDGTIYAVGYETNGAQLQDLVLLKIAPNAAIQWKRTVHNGVGDDRAVSIALTPSHVIVVGELAVGAGNKDIHVRKYVK